MQHPFPGAPFAGTATRATKITICVPKTAHAFASAVFFMPRE
jgi:hypothetical protein